MYLYDNYVILLILKLFCDIYCLTQQSPLEKYDLIEVDLILKRFDLFSFFENTFKINLSAKRNFKEKQNTTLLLYVKIFKLESFPNSWLRPKGRFPLILMGRQLQEFTKTLLIIKSSNRY